MGDGFQEPWPTSTRIGDGGDRSVAVDDPLQATLPASLARNLGRLVAAPPIDTLGEWVAVVREHTGGGPISVADLCHTDARTGHWAELHGDRFDFACFYDAVILAALAEAPVDLRTVSPSGAVIRAHASGSTVETVDPESAVCSFGVADAVQPPAGEPTHAAVYAAVCPYVKAFPTRGAYDRWDRSVAATTVAMPLADATALAAALVA